MWFGFHRVVPHRRPPGAGPHVVRLLPVHRMGGHHLLPGEQLHAHLLLLGILLILVPGQQSLLLLQTERGQPAVGGLAQSRQERPRLRREKIPTSRRGGTVYIEREMISLYIETRASSV